MLYHKLLSYILLISGYQTILAQPPRINDASELMVPEFDDAFQDGEQYRYLDKGKFHIWCNMSVNNVSEAYFADLIEVWEPNLVRFTMWFNATRNMTYMDDVIQPGQWIWTYTSRKYFFSYLKWPVDFPILSFGLLDSKSIPASSDHEIYMEMDVYDYNCTYKFGNIQTTNSIGRALKVFTHSYLLSIKLTDYSYSYWCYLAMVPGVKNTTLYQFGIYFGFPVDAVRYNCCRTTISRVHKGELFVVCLKYQIKTMPQLTVVPYVIGLVLFAYFPLVLLSYSSTLVNIHKQTSSGLYQSIVGTNFDTDDVNENCCHTKSKYVFLDGTSPISFTTLIGGLCGLVKKYPIGVSRFRRLLFVIWSPCLVYIKIFVYQRYQGDLTMALLDHGVPMGYLSMIGGFEKSRHNFVPVLGGPYLLLLVFHIAGFVFLILPNSPDDTLQYGSDRSSNYGNVSPLVYDNATLEQLSKVSINRKYGYARAAAVCQAGIYMLTNHKFWLDALQIQYDRIAVVYYLAILKMKRGCVILLLIVLMPLYLCLCIVELALCVLLYGVPLINGMAIVMKGYLVNINKMLQTKTQTQSPTFRSSVVNCFFLRIILAMFITLLFIYYVFSFCTIFTTEFSFLAKLVVFSLLSVIVYPSCSFGYLFFGLIFLYYMFKQLQEFGDGYFELLADAVEICENMEAEIYNSRVYNGTVIIENVEGSDITKLQVHNRIINLSTDQRREIRKSSSKRMPKVVHRDQKAGIPSDLFKYLVTVYRPVHIQVAKAIFRIFLVSVLIAETLSIVMWKPSPIQGVSEVMHVIFIMAIGALPRVLEVTLDNLNHLVKRDIKMRKMKATIQEYWAAKAETAEGDI